MVKDAGRFGGRTRDPLPLIQRVADPKGLLPSLDDVLRRLRALELARTVDPRHALKTHTDVSTDPALPGYLLTFELGLWRPRPPTISVYDEGTFVATQLALNFIGSGVAATEDATNKRVDVTITGGGSGDVATDVIWDLLGDIVYGTAPDAGVRLAGNITTTRKWLRQVGNGSVSAAPAWDTLVSGDIPTLDHGTKLTGLSDDDHTLYILAAGTRAFSGNQSMGGFKLTSLGTPTVSTDAATKAYVDAKKIAHVLVFVGLAESLEAGVLSPRPGICVGEAAEHGTFAGVPRGKAIAGTAGAGTTTILIEADDGPAFGSATVLHTLALNTATEVDDATLDNAWASGDIFVRARCSALGSTAPKDVVVMYYYYETVTG